ncbi:Crp/Fnr family transcriptional regulator [Alkalicoccus chagannorensis]|uniref:Crp/Fnr family transcriptional regulator n=1 Tax=Alkalicoccus chagannorensis TaxID=427072 RepID=UPI0003FA507F|nr:Crp/Fnr family transcriptional regulator [Alkalicoccus chagannorensis]
MDKLTLLSQINIFEELPMQELELIDAMSDMQPFPRGQTIFSPEKPIPALFLLKQGQVRLYRLNSQGREFTVDILTDGNIFGETSSVVLTDDTVTAETMTDTYVCIISREQFEKLIEQNPSIAMKLIDVLSARLSDVYKLGETLALQDVRHRLLYLLYHLSCKNGRRVNEWQTIDFKLTHQDLANMIGSTRETTSAAMSRLTKEGLVKKERNLFGREKALLIDADQIKEQLDSC